ncbi:hypothetical protein ACFQ58_14295 [Agromyces sp. NPDC056523]|uniref:hypothetical protein n=1 Tax=Agromyces sp. NPDC056523 TaxID=3345850 RepID=UPI00366AEC93
MRTAPGLPIAQRLAGTSLMGMLVAVVTLAIGVGGTRGVRDGLVAAVIGLAAGVVVVAVRRWFIVREARTRLEALRESVPDADAVAVRSTLAVTASGPVERDAAGERRKPGRSFQLLTLDADGFELRERPIGGPQGSVFVPWAAVEAIRVGSADFAEFTERAILIAADTDQGAFVVGLAPVDDHTLLLRPTAEHEYLNLMNELIRRAEAIHPLSQGLSPR